MLQIYDQCTVKEAYIIMVMLFFCMRYIYALSDICMFPSNTPQK